MSKILKLVIVLCSFATCATAQIITVTGRGEVQVAPDMARIQIGVTKEDKVADMALSQLSAELADVMAALVEAGLPPEDIQTSGIRLDLRQDYNSVRGEARITGYIASSDLRIKASDLSSLGGLLDAVVGAGVTQINSLQFDVAERAPHLEKARVAAVIDGRRKAEVFAGAADLTLGSLEELTEAGAMASPMRMEASLARDTGVPIAPGQITFSANVTMRYAAE